MTDQEEYDGFGSIFWHLAKNLRDGASLPTLLAGNPDQPTHEEKPYRRRLRSLAPDGRTLVQSAANRSLGGQIEAQLRIAQLLKIVARRF